MNINKKVQRRIEKQLGRFVTWDTSRSASYTNENLERVYIEFKVSADETQYKLKIQNFNQNINETTLHNI